MTDRGAIGFRLQGLDRITFNKYNSFPRGLGTAAFDAVTEFTDKQIADTAARLHMVSALDSADERTAALYQKTFSLPRHITDWYQLLEKAQGTLTPYLDGSVAHMIDSADFLRDSLFCEWAYILNADTLKLEIHTGFNRHYDSPGRYAHYTFPNIHNRNNPPDYFGVSLLCEIEFDLIRNLPVDDKNPHWFMEDIERIACVSPEKRADTAIKSHIDKLRERYTVITPDSA